MIMKFYKLTFSFTLIVSTLFTISAHSWLSMWIGLEINLLSIIPLMKNLNNIYPSEAAMKYFLTQACASSVLLFSIILSLNINSNLLLINNPSLNLILNSALLMKMGAAPFHFWFPEIMEGLNWSMSFIMLSWQKIAPFILIIYSNQMTFFLSIIIIFSSIIGGIMGFGQTKLRKILAFSSINHIGWMIASTLDFVPIWITYFIIYTFITSNLIIMFQLTNSWKIPQLLNQINSDKKMKFFLIMNFMSLGGLPPFLGFFPKWLVINNLINNNLFSLSLILIITTLITLFFYLRLNFSILTLNCSENKMTKYYKITPIIYTFNFLNLMGLFMCTIIFNIF